MRRLRILLLTHPDMVPPEDAALASEKVRHAWKTEQDVLTGLERLGHRITVLGVQDEIHPIREAIESGRPHIVFNLLEEFHGISLYDHNVVGLLELLKIPYTGCNPRGLMLGRGKSLSKKILTYHRIRVPRFAVFPRSLSGGRRARTPRVPPHLGFPLIVKSRTEEASLGIAQASIVDTAEKLVERVHFVHETIGTDAIAEQYIEGRELYVSVLGNRRLTVFPTWELVFENLPRGQAPIATERVKHDPGFQERWGVFQKEATRLPKGLPEHITRLARRIYRALWLDGYARLDFRLAAGGKLYFLEANPNPDIAESEEFASSAHAAGLGYTALLGRIVGLGLRRTVDGA